MRIGIYNCYWSTLGGGERYAATMAEILSRHHDVELIGMEPVSIEHLGGHLGLDLSALSFRRWGSAPAPELSKRTADYDLFINSTFFSDLRSQAARSAYVVFFPQPLMRGPVGRTVLAAARRLTLDEELAVVPLSGFHSREGDHQWTRDKARIRLSPKLFHRGIARLRFAPLMPWPLHDAIVEVRGGGISWVVEDLHLVLERPRSADGEVEIDIGCRTFSPAGRGASGDRRRLGVCLDYAPTSNGPWGRLRRRAGTRIERRVGRYAPDFLESYSLLLAISEFTCEWVQQRWRRPSEVLAPPVDTDTFVAPPVADKEKIILSVGRFFHGEHNKKHVEMIRAFRRMCDRGALPEGWELHLVGNVHRNRLVDLEYYADVERLAEGYPVRLLPDLPFSELQREYRQAAIFWHATGWGESERRRPEKHEHFGLTTCEAMSSGCIPVVIAKAGQLEIVQPGTSGFLFRNEAELTSHTARLAHGFGEPWTSEMMAAAVAEVERYNLSAFESQLLNLVNDDASNA